MEYDEVVYKQLLLNLLQRFDHICRNYQLRYFVYGGTALGAIRHKGIIPWDDDIDIGMPRSDYERLLMIAERWDEKEVEVKSIYNDHSYCYPFAKLYDTHTTLVEQERCLYVGGIFLDIFPLDGVPEDEEKRKSLLSRYAKARRICIALTIDNKWGECKSIKERLYWIKCRLFGLIFNREKWLRRCDEIAKTYKYEECITVQNFHGIAGYREIIPKACLGEGCILPFDGLQVIGPAMPDKYLTYIYGDYMTPPPIEKRKPHHRPFFIDLERRLTLKEVLTRTGK